jgi:hypothetical protein
MIKTWGIRLLKAKDKKKIVLYKNKLKKQNKILIFIVIREM